MSNAKKQTTTKTAPACPVPGCRAKKPHTDDDMVKHMFGHFHGPDKMLGWVCGSLKQLHDSMVGDYQAGRHFGWVTRMRQIEELYFRTLYVLFLVPDDFVPHVLSGDLPNSLSYIYTEVNKAIMHGQGKLTEPQTEKGLGDFTPMKLLHSGGHAGYMAMHHVAVFEASGQVPDINPYLKHIEMYIARVDHMRGLFVAGRDKQVVKDCITNMHRPAEVRAAAGIQDLKHEEPRL